MTPRAYQVPGPGTWEQDPTHFPWPTTQYVFDVFAEPFVTVSCSATWNLPS